LMKSFISAVDCDCAHLTSKPVLASVLCGHA
jgi:hypothetical protein